MCHDKFQDSEVTSLEMFREKEYLTSMMQVEGKLNALSDQLQKLSQTIASQVTII